jgi:hypothetical protein
MANQSTEEISSEQKPAEVHGRILTDEESHAWGQEVQIEEKAAKTEQNALKEEFQAAAKGENEAAEAAAEEAEDAEDAEETEEAELEQPETVYIDDPGEFMPKDYSFDVVTYDEDGNKPKVVSIKSIDEWEKLLESEPNLGSSLAVNKAFRQAQKMENGLDTDKREWEQKKAEYDEAVRNQEQQEQRNTQIFNEISYLMDKGDLPKLTNQEMNSLDWSDKAVVKAHPNIKPHADLLAFMRKENASRLKAGLNPMQSAMDAYNAMQLDGRRDQDESRRQQQAEARKAAGARVSSGSSTSMSSGAPKGIAVGRVGRGLQQLSSTNWGV